MIKIFNNQLAGYLLFSGFPIATINDKPINSNCIYGFEKEPGIKKAIEEYQEVKKKGLKEYDA